MQFNCCEIFPESQKLRQKSKTSKIQISCKCRSMWRSFDNFRKTVSTKKRFGEKIAEYLKPRTVLVTKPAFRQKLAEEKSLERIFSRWQVDSFDTRSTGGNSEGLMLSKFSLALKESLGLSHMPFSWAQLKILALETHSWPPCKEYQWGVLLRWCERAE